MSIASPDLSPTLSFFFFLSTSTLKTLSLKNTKGLFNIKASAKPIMKGDKMPNAVPTTPSTLLKFVTT